MTTPTGHADTASQHVPGCRVWISMTHGYYAGTCGRSGEALYGRFTRQQQQDGTVVFSSDDTTTTPPCLVAAICKRSVQAQAQAQAQVHSN